MDLPGFQAATTRMQETPQPLVVKGPMDVASFEAAITRVRESDRSAESVREEVKSDLDGGERGLSLDFMVPRQQEPSVKRGQSSAFACSSSSAQTSTDGEYDDCPSRLSSIGTTV